MNKVLDFPVYYEDTDATGLVYHASYLKYLDRARQDYLGIARLIDMQKQEGRFFVVKEAKLQYIKPARYGDILEIHSHFDPSHGVLLHCRQEIFRKSDKTKLLSADLVLVMVNERGFPVRLNS